MNEVLRPDICNASFHNTRRSNIFRCRASIYPEAGFTNQLHQQGPMSKLLRTSSLQYHTSIPEIHEPYKRIVIIIIIHGLGRLTCSGVDALPSSPGASTISSFPRFVVEGVFRESGVVHSFKMVDPVLFVVGSHVLYSRGIQSFSYGGFVDGLVTLPRKYS